MTRTVFETVFAVSIVALPLISIACEPPMSRDIVGIAAEGYVKRGLASNASVEPAALTAARKKVLRDLAEGWELKVRAEPDCGLFVTIEKPDERGAGVSVVVDKRGQLGKIFEHR